MAAGFTWCVPTEAVSGRMVRNLISTKGFCRRPTRCWRNSGAPVSSQPASHSRANNGANSSKPVPDSSTSKLRWAKKLGLGSGALID